YSESLGRKRGEWNEFSFPLPFPPQPGLQNPLFNLTPCGLYDLFTSLNFLYHFFCISILLINSVFFFIVSRYI
ncbi:hypothetical protein L9F63_020863, partial [Diploptera punctata]